ncbi:hypothetical protein Glove_428g72 [Diversispora epigaea]|uniref:BTB domain-containing protein n=1 Tax=Diversispora epigaea TaxID=1348612 RepID=A0A397GTG8_9GLOM|nr:hypothetical protein Glove_428g72 [Diversispora epigaea]
MVLNFFDKLSQNFTELLNDKDDYNVIIKVKNEKTFTAHSNILKCRSPRFRKELEDVIPNENNVKEIIKPNISNEIFNIILKYIYGGIVNLENVETRIIFDLMLAANEFELVELSKKLETLLIETKAPWLRTHFSLVYHIVFDKQNFKDLENFCNDIVVKYPNLIFDSSDFISLSESALVSLLKRDDLQMEETKIWEYTIKWGIAQNSTLPINLEEWVKENFLTLKTTLQQFKNEKTFTAHSNILKCRSPRFRKELEDVIPNENNVKEIIKPNISNEIFNIILKYIYGGIVNLENVETRIIFDLMLAANEFELVELSKKLETLLIETKAPWLRTHFSLVYHIVFDKQNFKDLENFCNDIVVKYPNLIFDSSDFISLSESALVSLLKRDDLQMEETKIWEYTIKWGIAQNSTLPINLEEWVKENFLTLKTTLQQCLPYIRYFHISGKDILDKVEPYKKILDKQLWKDLMQYSLDPERPTKSVILPARSNPVPELPARTKEPFSTIISDEHAAEISSWIDRNTTNYSSTNYPYEFQLIFQASRDGFNVQTIWNMCHGHAGTVIIIKVANTDEILGGYNPLMWDNTHNGGVYMNTNDSFIFSLKNGNIQNSILSRVKNPAHAVYYYGKESQKSYGPNFGGWFCITGNEQCLYNNDNGNYEKDIRANLRNFDIANYEVFKVKKKTA